MSTPNELEKTLRKMRVSIKAVELAGTPSRGFSSEIRTWRVTLTREPKGDEKALKLSLTIISANEPNLTMVVECLADDIEAGELSQWDFTQQFNRGENDQATERMYVTCKRTCSRAKRFFGDSKVVRNMLGIPKTA
jgi:hypothetical protein